MRRAHAKALGQVAAALVACVVAWGPARSQNQPREDVVARAMRDELTRTMAELRLEKADRPYFVAYTVTELEYSGASASFGSLIGGSQARSRQLTVEVRVGDYAFDNSNFVGTPPLTVAGMQTYMGLTELPLDDDYLEIRRQIWLATDGAYKQALENVAAKRAALLSHTRADSLADFLRAEVTHTTDDLPPVALDLAADEALARELSQAGGAEDIYASSVSVHSGNTSTRYVNSEGTSFTRVRPMVTVSATASTQAGDGMPSTATFWTAARTRAALPGHEELALGIRAMYARLDTVRNAPLADRYNGPVLFEGRAAAQLFSEQFAPSLAVSRKAISNNPTAEIMARMFGRGSLRGGASLTEKLGARVLPEFLSVVDDPTMAEYAHVALLGSYVVDDQGVQAHPTRLIENGILKTFLSGRTPVEGVAKSSGNFRGGGVGSSNMIVEATNGVSDAALRERLLALAKARGLSYGIVVRALGSDAPSDDPTSMIMEMMSAAMPGSAEKGRRVLLACKLFADGHEECVRGAQLLGMGLDAFKGIVAASSVPTVLHASNGAGISAMMQAASTGPSLASYVVPSLLFDDLTMTRRSDELLKPPFSGPPARRATP